MERSCNLLPTDAPPSTRCKYTVLSRGLSLVARRRSIRGRRGMATRRGTSSYTMRLCFNFARLSLLGKAAGRLGCGGKLKNAGGSWSDAELYNTPSSFGCPSGADRDFVFVGGARTRARGREPRSDARCTPVIRALPRAEARFSTCKCGCSTLSCLANVLSGSLELEWSTAIGGRRGANRTETMSLSPRVTCHDFMIPTGEYNRGHPAAHLPPR